MQKDLSALYVSIQNTFMDSMASRPVSVAERASWLLDLSTKNREKQQNLAPPKRTISTFASIRDKVQLFEQMTHPELSSSSQETPLSQHPVLSESFSSSSSSNTRTTSTSSSAEEPVIPPPPPTMQREVLESLKKVSSPKPLIRAEAPALRDFKMAEAKESEPTIVVSNDRLASNVAASSPIPPDREKDDNYEDDHIIAILQLANSAKSSPKVTPRDDVCPSPWDESDNFSDPWMMETSKDSVIPTTNVNIPPSWHPNALLRSNMSQSSHGTRSHVFADTDTEEDDDDIHTVVGDLDVGWTNAAYTQPSRESLSHLLQPPFMARYAEHDVLSSALKGDSIGVNVPKQAVTKHATSEHEKDTVRRIKSQSTRIPTLDRRELVSSVRSKKSVNTPSMENRDPAKNTDVTGSWFVHTFDNDDVAAASVLFPPSPLDLQYDASTNASSQLPSSSSSATLPRSFSPPVIRRFPMGSVSVPITPSRLMTHDITSTNAYTTAFLGNVFAEEMVAAESSNSQRNNTSIPQPSIVRPKSAFVLHPKPLSTSESLVFRPDAAMRRPCIPSLDASDNSHQPFAMKPKSDRIATTIAQLCQGGGSTNRFQRKSLVQTRQEQLATKLAKDRVKNHTTRGLWQKDANGNFKKQFVLLEDWNTKAVK
jgi:hypothetical protein